MQRSVRLRGSGFAWASIALVVLAATLRFWSLDFGLPNLLTRPDEIWVVRQIVRVAGGNYQGAFVNYPGGYVYLCWLWGEVALQLGGEAGYTAVALSDPQRVFMAGRALSAAAGTACVLLVMLVTRRSIGVGPALLAGLVLATNFLQVRDSHAMKPDSLVTLAGVVALAAIATLTRRRHTTMDAITAGLAVGCAMAMKYTAVLLWVPLYVAAVRGCEAAGWRRFLPRSAAVAAACGVGVFGLTSHYLVFEMGNLETIVDGLAMIFSSKQEEPGLALDHARASPSGFGELLKYHAIYSFRYGAGVMVTLLAPAALAWGLLSRRSLPLLAAVYCLAHCCVMSLGNQAFSRFMSPIMPMIALLEAGMLSAILTRLSPSHLTVGMALASVGLAAEPIANTLAHNRIIARVDTRVEASNWLTRNLEPGAVVGVAGSPSNWIWGEPEIRRPFERRRLRLNTRGVQHASVDVLVTHDHPLQFSTIAPEAIAQMQPRLRLLAEFDPFTERKSEAVFEPADAYYVPIHGFAGVDRAGPHVRIFAFE
jgi:hypothetical protein